MTIELKLPWTGERLVPEYTGDTAIEHLHRYAFAREFVRGKDVLDIASGEGYGSRILSKIATRVFGVDISSEAIEHARRRYGNDKLEFRVGSCTDIPLAQDCVDVIVCFETLEHLGEHDKMFEELKRVLRPNGVVIISTPDKMHYSVLSGFKNEFHVRELFKDEFAALITKHFSDHMLFEQSVFNGSIIAPCDKTSAGVRHYLGDYEELMSTNGIKGAPYLIAVAANSELHFDPVISLFRGKDIPTELEKRLDVAQAALPELQRELKEAQAEVKEAQAEVKEAQAEVKEAQAEVKEAQAEVKGLQAALTATQDSLAEAKRELEEAQAACAAQEEIVSSLYASRSWRITRPLRAPKQLVSKLFR